MNHYSSLSDDFYVNLNLGTEMELPSNRETVLHYFERIQKSYPTMRNFYSRDKGDFILEESKENGQYRWTTIEKHRISSGIANPDRVEDALEQHRLVLDLSPYMLAVSPLDCESLDLLFGFDFTYQGNHNQLVAEALGFGPALERLSDASSSAVINYEPSITLALDEECRMQCRLSIETRTTAYHIRTGEYPEDQLSVYLTARHYGSLPPGDSFITVLDRLAKTCADLVDSYVIGNVLEPLARTISFK